MTAETLGGHLIRSLEDIQKTLADAEKKDKAGVDKAVDKMEAELDRLTDLLRLTEYLFEHRQHLHFVHSRYLDQLATT